MDAETELAHLEGHVRELRISVRTHRRQLSQVADHLATSATITANQVRSLTELYDYHMALLAKVGELALLTETQAHLIAELADRITRLEGGEPGPDTETELELEDQAAALEADALAADAADHYAACRICQNGEPCATGDPIFAALHKACGYQS